MSLQGSFQTIALTDVMALLSSSKKSGELRVVGGQIEGRLWLQDGCLVESKVGKAQDHVDALFELLRLPEGNFVFKEGVAAPAPGEELAVDAVMHDAQERLAEWHDIEKVVPSLEHRVRLVADLSAPEVTLSADEWHLVMAVAMAATVRGVLDELGLGQFHGFRGIRRLVDAGLVLVEPPRARPPAPDATRPRRRTAVAPSHGSPRHLVAREPVDYGPAGDGAAAHPTNGAGSAATFGDQPGLGEVPGPGGAPLSEYDEPGDPDVVYFPVHDYEYDTSQFAVGSSPFAAEDDPGAAQSSWAHAASLPAPSAPAVHDAAPPVASPPSPGWAGSAPVDTSESSAVQFGLSPVDDLPAPSGSHEPDPASETLNRGMLLKFLSSVRT